MASVDPDSRTNQTGEQTSEESEDNNVIVAAVAVTTADVDSDAAVATTTTTTNISSINQQQNTIHEEADGGNDDDNIISKDKRHEIEIEEEKKLKAKYPQVQRPSSQFLQKRLQRGQKYFDSGDYNMALHGGRSKQ